MSSIRKTRMECNPPADDLAASRVSELDRLDRFLDSFREAKKRGNLWSHYDDKTIAIFRNKYGKFQWSIADAETVQYSKRGFASQEDAAAALLEILEGGA